MADSTSHDRTNHWIHVVVGAGLLFGLDHQLIGTVELLFGIWTVLSSKHSAPPPHHDSRSYCRLVQPQIPIGLLLV